MLSISHLVVIGCSFSYGQGLANPKEESWPGLLSKKLNVPVVNLSSRGGGNDRIMRRLAEYHYLDSAKNNNPFYILAFSQSSRREEYIVEAGDYSVISMKHEPELFSQQPFSESCILNYDPLVCARKKLMIRSYILDFLKINNINYLVTDFAPDYPDELESLREIYPKVYDRIYTDKYKLKDLRDISIKYPRLPCGHDDVEAQIEIGNYVYDELLLRYNTPTINLQDFTTLNQYREHYDIVGSRGDVEWL